MFRNIKLLSWLVVILLITNMVTILTVLSGTKDELVSQRMISKTEVPGDNRTHFFKEELNLTDEQLAPFRDANRRFNRHARGIANNMSSLRVQMLDELFADSVSQEKLQSVADEIGVEHRQLKMATCNFYLELKAICTPDQKEKLALLFQSLLNSDERVKLPGKRNRRGKHE